MSERRDHAELLLERAAEDVMAAEDLVTAGRALSAACFHAQQAVEKCLKALLALRGVPYPRSHDLRRLLDLAAEHFADVLTAQDDVVDLTPFAVEIWYGDVPAPTADLALHALEVARSLYDAAAQVIAEQRPDCDNTAHQ